MSPSHGSTHNFDVQGEAEVSKPSLSHTASHSEKSVRRVRRTREIEWRVKSIRYDPVPDAEDRQKRVFRLLYRKVMNEFNSKEVDCKHETL